MTKRSSGTCRTAYRLGGAETRTPHDQELVWGTSNFNQVLVPNSDGILRDKEIARGMSNIMAKSEKKKRNKRKIRS